jgi:uncharacterized protein
MVKREHWLLQIAQAWERRPIIWLTGVRRVGKTCLCRSVPDVEYFDCEKPRERQRMEDPESFLHDLRGRRIVLDEVHRLAQPSQLLKIAADHYPETRVLATGSSSLGASVKFKDTLTGRKTNLWLPPLLLKEVPAFGTGGLRRRMLHGGLPPFFLADKPEDTDFQEWMDAYWSKDILELFRLERRSSFQRLAELVFIHSGGIFEATRFAAPCEVSRTTIHNYLATLEETFVAHVIRPFTSRRSAEIVSAPKVYAFDTGFVCCFRHWDRLRPDDLGVLWEHLVLNELLARCGRKNIRYWRDKRGHEVDFVVPGSGVRPVAVECKWSAAAFSPENLQAFRRQYPQGKNLVVSHDVERSYSRRFGEVAVECVSIEALLERLAPSSPERP